MSKREDPRMGIEMFHSLQIPGTPEIYDCYPVSEQRETRWEINPEQWRNQGRYTNNWIPSKGIEDQDIRVEGNPKHPENPWQRVGATNQTYYQERKNMDLPAVEIIRGEVIRGPTEGEYRQYRVPEANWKGKDHRHGGLRETPYGKGAMYREQQNAEWYTQAPVSTRESADRDAEEFKAMEMRRQAQHAKRDANSTAGLKVIGSPIEPRPGNVAPAPTTQGRWNSPAKGKAPTHEWHEAVGSGKKGLLEQRKSKGQQGKTEEEEDLTAKITQIKDMLHTLQARQVIPDKWPRNEPEMQYQRNWTANMGKDANPWESPNKHTMEGSSNLDKGRIGKGYRRLERGKEETDKGDNICYPIGKPITSPAQGKGKQTIPWQPNRKNRDDSVQRRSYLTMAKEGSRFNAERKSETSNDGKKRTRRGDQAERWET